MRATATHNKGHSSGLSILGMLALREGEPHICGWRKVDAVIGLFGLQTLSAAAEIYHATPVFGLDVCGRCQRLRRKQRRILLVSVLVVWVAVNEKPGEISSLVA
jgi:hypothetical protein